jgi:hypothetical protein
MIATEPSHARERRWQPDLKNNVNSRRTVMRVVPRALTRDRWAVILPV